MSETSVDLEFFFGQCTLVLRSGTQTVRIKNHWVNDRVSDLAACVELLSDGTESAGCRWPGPSSEGHFVDFVTGPDGQVSIAVSEFRYPEGVAVSDIWSAERGDLVFSHRLPLAEFLGLFAATLRRVRATAVDRSGLIDDYPRPFPQSSFDRIELRAARLGYQATRLQEIEEPPSAP